MADVVFIAIALGFFAICVLYVRGLDRLVSSADEAEPAVEQPSVGRDVVGVGR